MIDILRNPDEYTAKERSDPLSSNLIQDLNMYNAFIDLGIPNWIKEKIHEMMCLLKHADKRVHKKVNRGNIAKLFGSYAMIAPEKLLDPQVAQMPRLKTNPINNWRMKQILRELGFPRYEINQLNRYDAEDYLWNTVVRYL